MRTNGKDSIGRAYGQKAGCGDNEEAPRGCSVHTSSTAYTNIDAMGVRVIVYSVICDGAF